MSSNKKIIAVIPARGGSKGIEKKNIRSFAGKPLIAHTIEQALASQSVQRIFVSTDDDEIASISKKCGAEIVWRPSGISNDTASSESALLHAVNELEDREQFSPDHVIFLQCTSPLRKPGDIDAAVQIFVEEKADSLLSVSKSHQFFWVEQGGAARPVNYDYKNRPRRQDFGEQYVENGSIYICKSRILKETKNRLGGKTSMYEMEKWQAFEVDDAEDFKLCEWLFQQHLKKKRPFKVDEKSLELIIYDFDGVMTDNRVEVDENGVETVRVNRSDGLAISVLKKKDIPQVIISTEKNPVVQKRAEKLGIPVSHSVDDKKDFVASYLKEKNIDSRNVVYVGNDINDLEAMKIVGLPIAPADAHRAVKRIAKYTTRARGGEGVVRELLDIIK